MVIGPGIHVYGIILVSGAIVGAYLASVEARRKGFDPNYVWDALIWAQGLTTEIGRAHV